MIRKQKNWKKGDKLTKEESKRKNETKKLEDQAKFMIYIAKVKEDQAKHLQKIEVELSRRTNCAKTN